MSKFISFMLVSLVVLLASCATVDYRKIMLLNNGSVNTAIVIRKDSRVFLQGDTLLLKRVGENKWSQSYNTVKDTIRVDRNHSKNGYRAQYARAVLLD
jgi:hypothetical protein